MNEEKLKELNMKQPKNQYCRYCANAIDYNGNGTDFICTAKLLVEIMEQVNFIMPPKLKDLTNANILNF